MSDETLEMLTAAVRRFAREELIPAEAQVEEDDDIPGMNSQRFCGRITRSGAKWSGSPAPRLTET